MALRCRSLWAQCNQCRHTTVMNVNHLPGDLTPVSFGPRMVCRRKCRAIGANVRPKWFAVRLTSAGIAKHSSARGGAHHRESRMSFLATSIESTRQTRWNYGLVALTLLGVFAIALALMLPNSITP